MQNTLLPPHFIKFITPFIPSQHKLDDFVAACHRPLRKSIRVNTLKISIEDFKELAVVRNWQLTPIPWCKAGFWLKRPEQEEQSVQLGNTLEHLSGLFYVQEASSMLPPQALIFNETNINMALDVAAAPGSKTTQIAALMNNKGLLLANEYSASRVKVLFSNVQRCGVSNVAITHMDGRLVKHLPETFDAILLDAPCSGEGTIRKDPDAMKNWTESSVHDIAATQADLIDSAFQALKPDGVLIYSTCTLNPYENQRICSALLNKYPNAVEFESLADLFPGAKDSTTAEGFLHVWPQLYDSEGFFVARIRKLASINTPQNNNPFERLGQFPYKPITQRQGNDFLTFLKKQFGFDAIKLENCYIRENAIWYFPCEVEHVAGKAKFNRLGVKLAETHKKGYKLDHSLAITFGQLFTKQRLELNKENTKLFYMGQDIRPDITNLEKSEVLLTYQNKPIGFGKNLGNRIKNQLARELVKDSLHNL